MENKKDGVIGRKTFTEKFSTALIGGVPLSETETEKKRVEGDCERAGRHEIRPVFGSIVALVGAADNFQFNVGAGKSGSAAELVTNNICPAVKVKSGTAVKTGGRLAGNKTPEGTTSRF